MTVNQLNTARALCAGLLSVTSIRPYHTV